MAQWHYEDWLVPINGIDSRHFSMSIMRLRETGAKILQGCRFGLHGFCACLSTIIAYQGRYLDS